MEKIREFRKKKGFSIAEMADYVGLTPNIVSKLEKDNIQISTGIKLALEKKGINVSITPVETPREVEILEKFLNRILTKCDSHCDICDKIVMINVITYLGRIQTTIPSHKIIDENRATIRNEAIAIAHEVVELTKRRLKND
jgi:transcriptional regulator with XRE-family HTH domain